MVDIVAWLQTPPGQAAFGIAVNLATDLLKLGFRRLGLPPGQAERDDLRDVFAQAVSVFLAANYHRFGNVAEPQVQAALLRRLVDDDEAAALLMALALDDEPALPALRERACALGIRADWFPGGFDEMLILFSAGLANALRVAAGRAGSPLFNAVALDRAERIERGLGQVRGDLAALRAEIEAAVATLQVHLRAPDRARPAEATIVTSYGQTGGITAGTVNVNAAPEPTVQAREVFLNRPEHGEYQSRVELVVTSPYPPSALYVAVHAASIRRINLVPQRSGLVAFGHSGTRQGMAFTTLQSPSGRILLEVFTAAPERLEIEYDIQ